MSKHQSFFERITGAVYLKNDQDLAEDSTSWLEETDAEEAEMAIDMYQTRDEIIIRAMPAGVTPDDVNISINNEVVKISAKRSEPDKINESNYLHRELYWGSFSRTIILPQEVDADKTEAIYKDGLLILHLPKIDRTKIKNLRVKSS